MLDYKNGKIYMIYPKCEHEEGDIYYGSTAEIRLSARMCKHRTSKNNECCCIKLFKKYGVENCIIELVEDFPCENRQQLNKREGYYIRENKCINRCIAGRTHQEYLEDNKEQIKIKTKEYIAKNIERITEYRNKHSKINYEQNKQKILENNKTKVSCPNCSKLMNKSSLMRHIKQFHNTN
tara:strand:+ start:107 stop:646 length:540 start_codon:yes stop_codon:yes gene_type:complete